MAKAKKLRPAWSEMGRWRWLAIVLVSIPVLLTGPYAMNSGGMGNGVGPDARTVMLGACPFRFQPQVKESRVIIKALLDGGCATALTQPELVWLEKPEQATAAVPFKGFPTALTGSIAWPEGGDLALLAVQANGPSGASIIACLGQLATGDPKLQPCQDNSNVSRHFPK
ncbi:MAG: hypothetical protein ACFBZ9_02740 [Sphingomonadales bacterium]